MIGDAMKKLNNKGFTVVEITLSFLFVFTVAFGMYGLIVNYRDRLNEESIKSQLLDYTNQVTLAIQNDITEKVLKKIDYCKVDDNTIYTCLNLEFNDGSSKQLAVENDKKVYDGEEYDISYIVYGGIIYEAVDSILLEYKINNMLMSTKISDSIATIIKINIPIYHNDLEGNHGISLVAVAYDYQEKSNS